MTPYLPFEARYALALSRIQSDKRVWEARAIRLAELAGYQSYPRTEVSPYIADELCLRAAFQTGWNQHHDEVRPRTREELQVKIDELSEEAHRGCGLYYELYAQNFTDYVNEWLIRLSTSELAIAKELLANTEYESNPEGRWTYDQEQGELIFQGYAPHGGGA